MAVLAAVDWGALGKVALSTVVATLLFTLVTCSAIVLGARAGEFGRGGRGGQAAVYSVLTAVALLLMVGLVVVGLIVMTSK